jgi:hypothetical protein
LKQHPTPVGVAPFLPQLKQWVSWRYLHEISISRNAHLHIGTGKLEYKIRVLDGNIEVTSIGRKLIVNPEKPNEINISQSRSTYRKQSA